MQTRSFFGAAGVISVAMFCTPVFAATVFGSRLNHEPTPAERCNANRASDMCSWVLTTGQQFVGREPAPKDGTVVKLRLRSCSAGSFVLQMVKAANQQTGEVQGVRTTGPTINYKGSRKNCNGGTFIETFNVSVPVFQGEYLAVVATRVGFIYNSSGDGSTVLDPPLADGDALRQSDGTGLGSGILLLQAAYND
jgi:hypothetical protein